MDTMRLIGLSIWKNGIRMWLGAIVETHANWWKLSYWLGKLQNNEGYETVVMYWVLEKLNISNQLLVSYNDGSW